MLDYRKLKEGQTFYWLDTVSLKYEEYTIKKKDGKLIAQEVGKPEEYCFDIREGFWEEYYDNFEELQKEIEKGWKNYYP